MTAAAPDRPMAGPLDVDRDAYGLSAAWEPERAVPVSRAAVRALVAVVSRTGGRTEVRVPDGVVRLEYPPAGRRVLLAVPCPRPLRTAECGRCGHWEGEHGHPAVVSACARYRLRIGPARFKVPEHGAVSYAWVRRMGRARLVFEISEPSEEFPGGTLAVHRYPGPGDGWAAFDAHRWPLRTDQRTEVLEWARAHVR